MDAQNNLIVGTEPNGLILRITPSGQGFVLYQSPKREITAVAIHQPDGAIYAAGVGNKTAIAQAAPPPAPAISTGTGGTPGAGNTRQCSAGEPGASLAEDPKSTGSIRRRPAQSLERRAG